jgi:hypothetical protein
MADISSYKGVWIFGEQKDGIPAGVVMELLGQEGSWPISLAFPFPLFF